MEKILNMMRILIFNLYFTGHVSGELDILGEDIEHDENCLLKGLIDNQLSLPEINRDGEFFVL